MEPIEKIKKKITVDFLVKKIENSLKSNDGYSKIDKKSVKILLEICGYESVSKRGLELYHKEKNQPEVIVNDAQLPRYETNVDDVVLRKSPTLKEMISFKNAKKILGDSDVLRSAKTDTLDYLRTSFIKEQDVTEPDTEFLLKELKIRFDAKDFDGFFKLILVGFEAASLIYLSNLGEKYGYFAFGRRFKKENDSFFSCIGLLDKKKNKFLFTKNEIKEKEFKRVLSDNKEDEIFLEGLEALENAGEIIKNSRPYNPFETSLFTEGLPENLNF
jgi:hypothetical protein